MSKCNEKVFEGLADLASAPNGGSIVFATDNFFAAAPNMIQPEDPIFIDDKFTEFGKWMDGWESRRKRTPGHDWCIVKLGMKGRISGFDINTAFFSGNYAPRASIQATCIEDDSEIAKAYEFKNDMGTIATKEQYEKEEELYGSSKWKTILERKDMGAGYPETEHNLYQIDDDAYYTHIRLNIFPDGGVARLRVYGNPFVDWPKLISSKTEMDVASVLNGGKGLAYSNAHYGKASNLIAPGRAAKMDEGWETKRKDGRPAILELGEDGHLILPGDDWALLELGHKSIVKKVLIDTNHFKGNFPESCYIQGCCYKGAGTLKMEDGEWFDVVPRCKLAAHEEIYVDSVSSTKEITHIKLTIYPDGGVSRLRVIGLPVE